MAKINHNNYLDTIDSLFTDAKQRGVLHLNSSAGLVSGREIIIQDKPHLNFGSLGYMGLETDERLKDRAVEFVQKFGTQSVMSRTYINTSIIEELEDRMEQMFGAKALVYSRVSTAHVSLIPTLVDRNDAIILDQQCHFSIQTASQLQRQKGVTIEMIKHNNLDMLEAKIKSLRNTKRKIWYMADGVYSMFGDVAPMPELIALAEKYPELWLYVDDAHGMSWCGKNGTGYVLRDIPLHPKLMLVSTLAKGFGVHGGVAVFPNEELYQKVKIFGGPLSYSLPLSPADIGACLASADIHLSSEIEVMQQELIDRVQYCNQLLGQSGLPVISNPETPIYFIGMGQPRVGYNMVSRLLKEGIYLNPSFFPMVPVKSTGLRFGLTRNHRLQDIERLVDAIAYHFPRALAQEGRTETQVLRAFGLKPLKTEATQDKEPSSAWQVDYHTSIHEMDHEEWNRLIQDYGTIDAQGMAFIEEAFSDNERPEENWKLHYFIVRDEALQPVVATFFVEGIFKDDFLSDPTVSRQVEEKRKEDPYFLTTKTLMSGSMISEGTHLHIDREHPKWKEALLLLLDHVSELQDQVGAKKVSLGDFPAEDAVLGEVFLGYGFFKVDMPHCNVLEFEPFDSPEAYLESLPRVHRKNVRKEAFKYEDYFEVAVKETVSKEEADHFYQLFLNVKRNNYGLNLFDYPSHIVEVMSAYSNWEFIVLNLKAEYDTRTEKLPIAVVMCYKGASHYSPMFIGMDYQFLDEYKLYKQALYQVVQRANALQKNKLYLGFSADTEKKKYGAQQISKVAYAQAKDNFNMEVLESMGAVGV